MMADTETIAIAQKLVAAGKGLAAMDDAVAGMNKRLASIKVAETEENRRGLPRNAYHHAGGRGGMHFRCDLF